MTRPASATKPRNDIKAKPNPTHAPAEPLIAMKPRPRLFVALLLIFLVWIGFLVALYFKTVYHKTDVHEPTARQTALP